MCDEQFIELRATSSSREVQVQGHCEPNGRWSMTVFGGDDAPDSVPSIVEDQNAAIDFCDRVGASAVIHFFTAAEVPAAGPFPLAKEISL